jgi:hypothetical protein
MLPCNLRHLGPVTYWAVDADGTLLAVPIERSMAVAAYLALFFLIAVGRRDRASFLVRAMELIGRRGLATAA